MDINMNLDRRIFSKFSWGIGYRLCMKTVLIAHMMLFSAMLKNVNMTMRRKRRYLSNYRLIVMGIAVREFMNI